MDIIQVKNPKTERWIKIDRTSGLILGNKSGKPWEGIKIQASKIKANPCGSKAFAIKAEKAVIKVINDRINKTKK